MTLITRGSRGRKGGKGFLGGRKPSSWLATLVAVDRQRVLRDHTDASEKIFSSRLGLMEKDNN